MTLTNVFLSIALFFNTMNIINFNSKDHKNAVSVEKNDIMSLKLSEFSFDIEGNAPKYFIDSSIKESKFKSILNKNFENEFSEFYASINNKMGFLHNEVDKLLKHSQAFSSEYIFHRKNHIVTQIKSLTDRIDNMSIKDRRKIICYEYINEGIEDYNGLLGFSIIYNDKENPYLIGTIVMPNYIGEIETILTSSSINRYKSKYKIIGDMFYSEPLNYFDRYYLSTLGFK